MDETSDQNPASHPASAKQTHGGKREGAGQKPKRGVAKVTLSLRVTPDVKSHLEGKSSASEFVETIIRKSKDFRDWLKSKG